MVVWRKGEILFRFQCLNEKCDHAWLQRIKGLKITTDFYIEAACPRCKGEAYCFANQRFSPGYLGAPCRD